jgi:hypothetical protein
VRLFSSPQCASLVAHEAACKAEHDEKAPSCLRLTLTTKRVSGDFREIAFLENRIFDLPPLLTLIIPLLTYHTYCIILK